MASSASVDHNALYTDQLVPLHLIDDPAMPQRETIDEVALAELALSINDVGLIEPIVLKVVGERFEVIAGHRRLLACQAVSYSPVPARVRADSDIDPLAILIAENAHREDPNAIEEARFYARVLEAKCGGDVDKLCDLVRRGRDYVEGRLLLLMGHPKVVDALATRQISIAVARGLNKCQDPNRLILLLDTAIQSGATARQVAEWVREANGMAPIDLPADPPAAAAGDVAGAAGNCGMICVFCQSGKHPHTMQPRWIHDVCSDMLDQALGRNTPHTL